MAYVLIGLLLVGVGTVCAIVAVIVDRARLRRWAATRQPRSDSTRSNRREITKFSVRHIMERAWTDRERALADRAAAIDMARRLEASLDVLPSGMVVCDRRGRVVARNSAAEAFAVARHGEVLVADALDDLLTKALSGQSDSIDIQLLSEPRRTFEVTASPVEVHGRVLGAVALVRNITEQHRIDAVRRDFVANVSHELKSPIGALSLLTESLSFDNDAEVFNSLVERIQSEVQRVANTIDDLLTLSYIEDNENRADKLVDITAVVHESMARISEAAAQRNVTVEYESRESPMSIRGSRVQLVSALFNLLDNAVKFTEPGGRVKLTTDRSYDTIKISVRDNGVGIPAADQPRIFERFYRVNRSRSRHSGGTGLGLSIVRHAVLNHGGDVHVTSREGRGSVFTISLPVTETGSTN